MAEWKRPSHTRTRKSRRGRDPGRPFALDRAAAKPLLTSNGFFQPGGWTPRRPVGAESGGS